MPAQMAKMHSFAVTGPNRDRGRAHGSGRSRAPALSAGGVGPVEVGDVVQILQASSLHRLDGDHGGLRSVSEGVPTHPLQANPCLAQWPAIDQDAVGPEGVVHRPGALRKLNNISVKKLRP
jgi:hypothetical protein